MFDTIKKIFTGEATDFTELVKEGAVIVDVRSKAEFSTGNISGSVNIPLDTLKNNLHQLKSKQRQIITCCASGMRSASAVNILISNGFTNVYNGGGWKSLSSKISS